MRQPRRQSSPGSGPPHNLPAPPSPLLGREAELADLERLLAAGVRLLTVTGPPGVGKTRLALAAAAATRRRYPDGAWFVNLAPVRDPAAIPTGILAALGLAHPATVPPAEALVARLGDRRLLLFLDNLEHLLPAVADLVARLVAAPRVVVLTTSREPLRLRAEQAFPLPPLPLPDPRATDPAALARVPSVALFAERARAVDPAFALTAANGAAVADLCVRLDGLPLAIELAASRTAVLPPAALLARLDRRLPLPAGGPRDHPDRHRTLEAAIAWSHDLLPPAEQALFRRLAVFAGGFTLEAAEAVASREVEASGSRDDAPPPLDSPTPRLLDSVAALVAHSLLRRDEEPEDRAEAGPRFRMLETIRADAAERLEQAGEGPPARQRHAEYFLRLAERAEPELTGPDQAAWLDRLGAEADNLRAALAWSLSRGVGESGSRVGRAPLDSPTPRLPDSVLALRLAAALARYWYVRGDVGEGRRWLEAALAGAPARTAARTKALVGLARLASSQGDHDRVDALLTESAAIGRDHGDGATLSAGLLIRAVAAEHRGDLAAAADFAAQSEAGFRAAGDRWGEALARRCRGLAALPTDPGAAAALLAESVAGLRAVGDPSALAWVLVSLGEVAAARGEDDRAATLAREAAEIGRRIGNPMLLAVALGSLGFLALGRGDPHGAAGHLAEAASLHRDLGDRGALADSLAGAGATAALLHRPESAARLSGAAAALRDLTGAVPAPRQRAIEETHLPAVRAALGAPAFAAAQETGRGLTPEAATREVADLAATSPPPPAAPSPSVTPAAPATPLTGREREILALVAEGLTNREIADRLAISPRTVENHLAAVYAKLGVASRTAALRQAARCGALPPALPTAAPGPLPPRQPPFP